MVHGSFDTVPGGHGRDLGDDLESDTVSLQNEVNELEQLMETQARLEHVRMRAGQLATALDEVTAARDAAINVIRELVRTRQIQFESANAWRMAHELLASLTPAGRSA